MPSSADLGPLDPVLEDVYRRGYRIRRTRRIARIGMAAVVLQLALALPLLASADSDSDTNLRVTMPAGEAEETTTTAATEVAGVVYEATTTTAAPTTTVAPPTTTTTVAVAAVYGVIGAGEGGHGHAYLEDAFGHRWEALTDDYGNYRFDRLAPGRYTLSLGASSAMYPCEPPPAACLGPASVIGPTRSFDLRPGEARREDFEGWGEPTTPATRPTVPQHPATTTTTTAEVPAQ